MEGAQSSVAQRIADHFFTGRTVIQAPSEGEVLKAAWDSNQVSAWEFLGVLWDIAQVTKNVQALFKPLHTEFAKKGLNEYNVSNPVDVKQEADASTIKPSKKPNVELKPKVGANAEVKPLKKSNTSKPREGAMIKSSIETLNKQHTALKQTVEVIKKKGKDISYNERNLMDRANLILPKIELALENATGQNPNATKVQEEVSSLEFAIKHLPKL